MNNKLYYIKSLSLHYHKLDKKMKGIQKTLDRFQKLSGKIPLWICIRTDQISIDCRDFKFGDTVESYQIALNEAMDFLISKLQETNVKKSKSIELSQPTVDFYNLIKKTEV